MSDSNARLTAARRLTSRRVRREAGRFLVEGAQAVREALKRPDLVIELYWTAEAAERNPDLVAAARAASLPDSEISDKAAAALSETVTPQGLVAVCDVLDVALEAALVRRPRLAAVLVETNDPGNAGTILRTADAAGAGLVVVAGDSVDPYNGKAVRASAGSLFHLDLVVGVEPLQAVSVLRQAGLLTLATTGTGGIDLDALIDDERLRGPTAWIFGNEARGLGDDVICAADASVRVPVHGQAESLNLAAAAAVCLYASARELRHAR